MYWSKVKTASMEEDRILYIHLSVMIREQLTWEREVPS